MFRLIVAILVILMGDWVFFDGDAILRPLAGWVEAGAEFLADLVFQIMN